MPESLEQLDLLLLTVARPRVVQRDGIRFQGFRYLDLTLAAYVGEPVTIRYDPRDLAEIRVFHRDRFLCRAITPELADQQVGLRDVKSARTARRREVRADLNERLALAEEILPTNPPPPETTPAPRPKDDKRAPKLKRYRNE